MGGRAGVGDRRSSHFESSGTRAFHNISFSQSAHLKMESLKPLPEKGEKSPTFPVARLS